MRIQILPLPSAVVGDDAQEPFALIVDQHNADMDETTADAWRTFKDNAGARALLITPDTVEVVDRYAETTPQEPAAANPLEHSCFVLSGDEDGGVGLHCRDHFDGGRPLAYYGAHSPYPATKVPAVTTIRQLQEEAAKHLASNHGPGPDWER